METWWTRDSLFLSHYFSGTMLQLGRDVGKANWRMGLGASHLFVLSLSGLQSGTCLPCAGFPEAARFPPPAFRLLCGRHFGAGRGEVEAAGSAGSPPPARFITSTIVRRCPRVSSSDHAQEEGGGPGGRAGQRGTACGAQEARRSAGRKRERPELQQQQRRGQQRRRGRPGARRAPGGGKRAARPAANSWRRGGGHHRARAYQGARRECGPAGGGGRGPRRVTARPGRGRRGRAGRGLNHRRRRRIRRRGRLTRPRPPAAGRAARAPQGRASESSRKSGPAPGAAPADALRLGAPARDFCELSPASQARAGRGGARPRPSPGPRGRRAQPGCCGVSCRRSGRRSSPALRFPPPRLRRSGGAGPGGLGACPVRLRAVSRRRAGGEAGSGGPARGRMLRRALLPKSGTAPPPPTPRGV